MLYRVALPELDFLLITGDDSKHNYYPMKQLIAPQGKICSRVQTKAHVDRVIYYGKNSLFQTYDMIAQHHLLNTVADLIDRKNKIKNFKVSPTNAENLRKARKNLESGSTIGRYIWLLNGTLPFSCKGANH